MGALQKLGSDPSDEELQCCLETHLPFALRSTYGGNTTCVEVQTPDSLIVFDSGSGFRELGIDLARRWNKPGYKGDRCAHLMLSHAHMDHTFATPFIDVYYDPRCYIKIWGSIRVLNSLNVLLDPNSPMRGLYFPPTYDFMRGIREFEAILPDKEYTIGSTKIRTMALNHPGDCLGFRLECNGKVFVFATDHEQLEDPDPQLAKFVAGADLLYIDSQYTRDEYHGRKGLQDEPPLARRGWGHSTFEGCVATAIAAGVKQLHLGHREPKRSDFDLQQMECIAQELMRRELSALGRDPHSASVCLACEGQTIHI